MPLLHHALFDALLPALFALAVLGLTWRRREHAPKSSEPARCIGAWAFGLALIAAQASIYGELVPPWAARQLASKDWLPAFLLAAAGLATLALVPRVRDALPRSGAALVVAGFVVASTRAHWGTDGVLWATIAVFGCAMLTWSTLELASERLRGPSPSLVLALAVAANAGAAYASGATTLARLGAALATLLAATAVIAWRRRVFTLAGGPAAAITLTLTSIWIGSWVFGALPTAALVCSVAALAVPCYAGLGPFSAATPRRRELARYALVALIGGTALYLAWPRGAP